MYEYITFFRDIMIIYNRRHLPSVGLKFSIPHMVTKSRSAPPPNMYTSHPTPMGLDLIQANLQTDAI